MQSYENAISFFQQNGTNNPKTYMEPENTPNRQRNAEKENQSWWHHNSRLQALLQSCYHQDTIVLAQKTDTQISRTE